MVNQKPRSKRLTRSASSRLSKSPTRRGPPTSWYVGKVLESRREFRDLYYIFVLVLEVKGAMLTVADIPVEVEKDLDCTDTGLDLGWTRPRTPVVKQTVSPESFTLRNMRGKLVDAQGNVFVLWDRKKKPYRCC